MGMKKAQSSIEILFIIAFGFMLITLSLIALTHITQSATDASISSESTEIGEALVNNAQAVYLAGKGTKALVEVYFPDNVLNLSIENNNYLLIVVKTYQGSRDLLFYSDYPLNATFDAIDYSKGAKIFEFTLNENGDTVMIRRV